MYFFAITYKYSLHFFCYFKQNVNKPFVLAISDAWLVYLEDLKTYTVQLMLVTTSTFICQARTAILKSK